MQRFYLDDNYKLGENYLLTDEEIIWQLRRVLRIKEGKKIILFDGRGKEMEAIIQRIDREGVLLFLKKKVERKSELPRRIYLYQAILKHPAKFEEVLASGTQLGIDVFVPLITERVQGKPVLKEMRLKRIIVEAVEQSERSHIPFLEEVVNIKDIFLHPPSGLNLFLAERNMENLLDIDYFANLMSEFNEPINVFVGPEGGFSENEIKMAKKANFIFVNLGPRILRSELAGSMFVAVLGAIIQNKLLKKLR